LAHYGILASLVAVFAMDLTRGLWIHASFVAVNGLLLSWAVVRLVGLRAAAEDFRLAWGVRREERSIAGGRGVALSER
jgi:hypothetical protein